jgi:hypothetical protein
MLVADLIEGVFDAIVRSSMPTAVVDAGSHGEQPASRAPQLARIGGVGGEVDLGCVPADDHAA